jgi:2-oxoisovalerate dehydrogenase E1 component
MEKSEILKLYEQMVLLREFEMAAQVACRSGETPGFLHLYIGEEATAVGICAHLTQQDWITSTHRGHGHALAKGMDPKILMAELYGKQDGCCGGRGGTMHLYDRGVGLFGTNGLVGGGIPSAVGVGLAAWHRQESHIGVAFFGDGAVNHAAFHEALNLAAIQCLPVLFVCENNLYATATPLAKATLNTEVATKAQSYGMRGVSVDGNDVFAMWEVAREAIDRARRGDGPTLIESKTYRVVAHHEGDPVTGSYRTKEEVEEWKLRDPIDHCRQFLLREYGDSVLQELEQVQSRIQSVVSESVEFARNSPYPDPSTLAQHVWSIPLNPPEALQARASTASQTTGWLDAVRDGIAEEMRANTNILYLGEGTGERGGTFAHTKGLFDEFGPKRMIDTPISELGFTGTSLGASAVGVRCIADLMFADFLFEAGSQIALQAAKLRYMSNGQMSCPMVVRVGAGAIRSAGPHHSGMYYTLWGHVPGLIVCVPSNPADAKGLMKTALRAGDPVLFLEPKILFSSKGEVPEGEYWVPFGQARIARTGTDITLAAVGAMVGLSIQAAEVLQKSGISCEVIDMRTIQPLDVETVARSVMKTNHLLVVDEAWSDFGVGAELGQAMNELAFDYLDAPVGRLHSDPVSHPFAPSLEKAMLVNQDKIVDAVQNMLKGIPPSVKRNPLHLTEQPAPTSPAGSLSDPTLTTPKESAAPVAKLLEGEPVTMPFGDLTVDEGVIVQWLKAVGDMVEKGEIIVEIETDKALVEVESTTKGRLGEIIRKNGDTVKMGERIATIITQSSMEQS